MGQFDVAEFSLSVWHTIGGAVAGQHYEAEGNIRVEDRFWTLFPA